MQIDIEKFDHKIFITTLPEIVRLYFGSNLELEKHRNQSFALFHKNRKMLTVLHRPHHIDPKDISKLMREIASMKSSAGLVVSESPQAFAVKLFERRKDCWLPVAIWGRTQVFSIASLNSEILFNIVPFKRRYSQGKKPSKSVPPKKGGLLWSDIVRFKKLGIDISQKIGLDPANVRRQMLSHVDSCFQKATVQNATHTEFMGTDGWFHFYQNPRQRYAVQLAIDAMAQIRRIAGTHHLYDQQEFKVVMGINQINNLQLILGRGPLDDDSILTHDLLKKQFEKYDIRATKTAVSNLVNKAQKKAWVQYENLSCYDGRIIEVFGHS